MSAPPTGVLFNEARAKPLSTTGAIQPGAYYQFYLTQTLTPTNVYADGLLATPLSQTPGSGGTTAASDGRLVPIYLNPATTYRYQLYSATAVLLEDVDPYIPVSVPTQAQIGQALYPQTAAELAANITPVNFAIPSHTAVGYAIVDRYGTNTIPGTTDMSTALQGAVSVALATNGAGKYGIPIRFNTGAYKIVTPPTFGALTVNQLPIDIGGAGFATQIINAAPASTPTFSVRSGFYLHDMLLTGNDSNPNDGMLCDGTTLQVQRWRIERCVFFMAGSGIICKNTNTGIIKDCLFWPDDGGPLLTVSQSVTLTNVSHHIYLTGGFAHDIAITNCDANVRAAFAVNQRGLKCDATFSYGCLLVGGSYATSSGLGLTSIDIANANSWTILAPNIENVSAQMSNSGNCTITSMNNLQTTGGFTLTSNSNNNVFSGFQLASINWDSSCMGNVTLGGAPGTITDSASPSNIFIGTTTSIHNAPATGLSTLSRQTPGSGGTITPDCRVADFYELAVNGAGAFNFTIANPINPIPSMTISIDLRNIAGSTWTGTLTWGAKYKVSAFTNLVNGTQRTHVFKYNQAQDTWIQQGATVDVAL